MQYKQQGGRMSFLRRCKVESQTTKFLTGVKDYCKRLLAQTMIQSPLELNAFLHTPKTIVEIAEEKGMRNLKLVELVLESLASQNILKREGAKYRWQGYDFNVTEQESELHEQAPATLRYFSALADNLHRVLTGTEVTSVFPLVALDAFFSSDYLKQLVNQALISMKELISDVNKPEVIVDLVAGTGWSTIYLAEKYKPKKIYAVGSSNPRLLPLAQENINLVLEDSLATTIEFLPTPLMESPIREKVDLVFGYEPFQWILSSDWIQFVERIYSLLNDDGCIVGFQMMRDQSTPASSLPIESIFSVLQQFTQFPPVDNIQSILLNSGFPKPMIVCNSFFFAQKQPKM